MARQKNTKISTLVFETKYSLAGPKILLLVMHFLFAYKPIHFFLPWSSAIHRTSNYTHWASGVVNKLNSIPHYFPLEIV